VRQSLALASSLYNHLLSIYRFLNNMDDRSQSSHFRALFDTALHHYQMHTGTTLSSHPLAEKLHHCDSVNSVTDVLREQAQAFSDFQDGERRITKSLEAIVSVLHTLSENYALGEGIGLVRLNLTNKYSVFLMLYSKPFPPAKLIFAGFAILLAVRSFLISYVYILVTCQCVRRSRTLAPAMMFSSIFSNR
jgi:hypothetical protein